MISLTSDRRSRANLQACEPVFEPALGRRPRSLRPENKSSSVSEARHHHSKIFFSDPSSNWTLYRIWFLFFGSMLLLEAHATDSDPVREQADTTGEFDPPLRTARGVSRWPKPHSYQSLAPEIGFVSQKSTGLGMVGLLI